MIIAIVHLFALLMDNEKALHRVQGFSFVAAKCG